jgi:hypothetical protein
MRSMRSLKKAHTLETATNRENSEQIIRRVAPDTRIAHYIRNSNPSATANGGRRKSEFLRMGAYSSALFFSGLSLTDLGSAGSGRNRQRVEIEFFRTTDTGMGLARLCAGYPAAIAGATAPPEFQEWKDAIY